MENVLYDNRVIYRIYRIIKCIYHIFVNIRPFRLSTELDTPQPVAAQPVREDPKRGHRQVIVVADQPQRESDDRQVQAPGHVHGDAQIREETRPHQEGGRGHAQRSASREHAQSQLFHFRKLRHDTRITAQDTPIQVGINGISVSRR